MNLPGNFNFVLPASVWPIVKLFFLICFLIYIGFAFIVVRQVSIMIKVLSSRWDWILKGFSLVLLGVAIFSFIIILLFL